MTCLVMESRFGFRTHNMVTLPQLSRVFPPPRPPCHTYTLVVSHPDEFSGFLSGFPAFTLSAFPSSHLHVVANRRFLKRMSDLPQSGGSCPLTLPGCGHLSFLVLYHCRGPLSMIQETWWVPKTCRRFVSAKLSS